MCLSLFYNREIYVLHQRTHASVLDQPPLRFILQNRMHANPLHSWIYSSASENLFVMAPPILFYNLLHDQTLQPLKSSMVSTIMPRLPPATNHSHQRYSFSLMHAWLFLCCTTNTLCAALHAYIVWALAPLTNQWAAFDLRQELTSYYFQYVQHRKPCRVYWRKRIFCSISVYQGQVNTQREEWEVELGLCMCRDGLLWL